MIEKGYLKPLGHSKGRDSGCRNGSHRMLVVAQVDTANGIGCAWRAELIMVFSRLVYAHRDEACVVSGVY